MFWKDIRPLLAHRRLGVSPATKGVSYIEVYDPTSGQLKTLAARELPLGAQQRAFKGSSVQPTPCGGWVQSSSSNREQPPLMTLSGRRVSLSVRWYLVLRSNSLSSWGGQ